MEYPQTLTMPDERKRYKGRWVEPVRGQALVYRVESRTDPDNPHTCDLSQLHGHGICTCRRWQTACVRALNQGLPYFAHETSCAHLHSAREYWMQHSLKSAAEEVNR